MTDPADPKRELAAPAAGRRSDLALDKEEEPLHSIQKRSVLRYPEEIPEWKRRFNPWAGKRSVNEDWLEQIKRNFNPWGGKKRAAPFSSWGGKRSIRRRDEADVDGDERKALLLYTLKRQSFRPWGGK